MSKKCNIKIVYKEQPTIVVVKENIFKFPSYEDLKKKIINSNITTIKKKLTEKEKFILEIEGEEIPGLSNIWNAETFNYFIGKIESNNPGKMKLNIVRVDKYPDWKKPQYTKILKKSLQSAWESTKKEIEDELTEKYLNDGQRLFFQEKKEKDANLEEEYYKILHSNIVCNNCLSSNFSGTRYICAECNNFNLCEYCQENARVSHKSEHTFIKLNKPVLDDIQKYNSIFFPNKQLLKHKEEPFEIVIEIVNNGENNLQGCFISPIRFGKNYLGCLKKTIIDDCKNGDKISLEVLIKFEEEEDEEESPDVYEGYFRLMTKDGIPFGDIFNIKVICEE